jgi:hypothetical protein
MSIAGVPQVQGAWPPRGRPPCAHGGRDGPEGAAFAYLGHCPSVLNDDLVINVIVRGEKSRCEHCLRIDRDSAAAETHRGTASPNRCQGPNFTAVRQDRRGLLHQKRPRLL